MARALDAYVGAGRQYELLSALTACALDTPEDFDTQLELFRHALPYGGMSSASAEYYLTAMLETGKVMPWSGRPMDEAACKKLFTLAADREEEYALFASVLQYVMQDAYAGRNYGAQYPQLLSDLLETDADIAAALYQIVNSRLLSNKATIISSNLPAGELERRYSPQIASRLLGTYELYQFRGSDIRMMET